MRAGNRVVAVLLAAAVWIYAAMAIAPGPAERQAVVPSVLDAAASAAVSAVD
jgi:hypothetical protein